VEQEGLVLQVHLERLAVRGAQVVLAVQVARGLEGLVGLEEQVVRGLASLRLNTRL
jgi:hypothetical protein